MKIVSRAITSIIAALVALLAVANRQAITVSLDPLPFEVTGPLYALLLGAAVLGATVGGFMGWTSGLKWRRTARRQRRELAAYEKRLGTINLDADVDPTSQTSSQTTIPARITTPAPIE